MQVDDDAISSHFRSTGSPVPHGWRPRPQRLSAPRVGQRSVAQLTEQQVVLDATITYVYPRMITRHQAKFTRHAQDAATRMNASLHARASDGPGALSGPPRPSVYVYKGYISDTTGEWVDTDGPGHWGDDGEWVADPEPATEPGIVKDPWETGEPGHWGDDGEWVSDAPAEQEEEIDESRKTGISRCGFSWDDAAAKLGSSCSNEVGCVPPEGTVDDPDSYWYGAEYECYTDVPDLGGIDGLTDRGKCEHASPATTDEWCTSNCNTPGGECDPTFCKCEHDIEREDVFNPAAPIADHDSTANPGGLPTNAPELIEQVKRAAETQPSSLPACLWQPTRGCTKTAQYQCISGKKKGQCSGENWFEHPSDCTVSCVHVSLLPPAPYYALWYPGPLAREFEPKERQPRYKHTASKLTLHARGIDLSKSDVMMSATCKSSANQFVGISLYSPKYEAKAKRLLRSCARVGVCCKATFLPPDAFGQDALEGTEAFRYEVISSKPSFILDELEATKLPVVFLDTDLEFASFPHLFVKGGWPNGGRDVAIFNFWGNETDPEHASTPNTGSGVVFFNHTRRAKSVLTAWAEAMAWEENTKAPDDQVFDTILKAGGWLSRASFGWLPASYLRTMPAYYRGITPVIDHDHGSSPGLTGHSEKKPHLPPVDHMELCDPGHGKKGHKHEAAPPHLSGQQEVPEQSQPEPEEEEDEAPRFPTGTCKATNAALEGDSQAQLEQDRWCNENCVPQELGGLGTCHDGTETGAVGCKCKPGVKACIGEDACKLAVIQDARAQEQAATTKNKAKKDEAPEKMCPGHPMIHLESDKCPSRAGTGPNGEGWALGKDGGTHKAEEETPKEADAGLLAGPQTCIANNPELQPDAKNLWSGWCQQVCQPPHGALEDCATADMTGAAMCECKPSSQDEQRRTN